MRKKKAFEYINNILYPEIDNLKLFILINSDNLQ